MTSAGTASPCGRTTPATRAATARADVDGLQATLTTARRLGAQWCEVFLERRQRRTVRLDGRQLDLSSDVEVGAAVRVLVRGRMGHAATTDTSAAGLDAAARAAVALLGSGPARESHPPGPASARRPTPQQSTTGSAVTPLEGLVDRTRRAAAAAREVDRRVRRVAATLVDVQHHVVVVSSDGVLADDERWRARLTCRATARDGDRQEVGFEGPGGSGPAALMGLDPERAGQVAAQRALRMLGGSELATEVVPVVFGPGGGGLLVHEACGHGLEADGLARGASAFARTRGAVVGGGHLTIVDDPSLPGAFGSYGCDDEGLAVQPTVLVDAGVQVGALTDASTAVELGGPRTANGRRESAAHAPQARMSNTFIAPGHDHPADVVADVRRGLYVRRLSGGEVDPVTGDFAFTASDAQLIEHGRLTTPVTGVAVLGNGPRVLGAIDAIGDDLAMVEGLCGKGGQWVPVAFGSPTLRVQGLTVTST